MNAFKRLYNDLSNRSHAYDDFVNRYSRFLVLALALFLFASPIAAQEPVTDDEVNDIARNLYCPTCENTPLDACPTQACQDWRDEIRTQLSQGRSRQEIEQYFVARYGAQVLAQPRFSGFDILVWLLPILAVLVGGFFFWRYLRHLRDSGPDETDDAGAQPPAQSTAPEPPPASDDDEYVSRVEKEVREG